MEIINAAASIVGTLAMLFLGAMCIGAGLHLGLRIGAEHFGAVKVSVTHQHRWPDDGSAA